MTIKRFDPLLEKEEVSKKEANKYLELSSKVSKELGLNLHITASFGFGVGFFYPIIHNLIKNMNLNFEITDEMAVMLTMSVFAILFKDNKQQIKKLLEELRLNGTYGIAKKLVRGLECIKDILVVIAKNLGKSVNTIVDIFSYTAIFMPCAMALNSIITKNNLDLDSFINYFITFGIGTLTITAKHYFTDLIDKLKNSFKLKLDDSKLFKSFKTSKDIVVKKFNQFDESEIINETGLLESEKYMEDINNETY